MYESAVLCYCALNLMFTEVKSVCDSYTIANINSLWGDNAPKDILKQLTGSMTYLYVPKVLASDTPGFKCIKTVLEDDYKMAVDYHMYENADDVKAVRYQMTENEVNITRSYSSPGDASDDYIFPAYLNKGVFGFWQCRSDYEGFINIGVLNYGSVQEDEEVKEAITEAETKLLQLGIDFPSKSPGC